MTLIKARALVREYQKGQASIRPLDGLDLDVQSGEFLALMGPSGSGKTTLLNCIAGIDTPTSGTLDIDGQDITKLSRSRLATWRASHVGYVFQLYNLVPVLTAYENIELPLLLHPLSRRQRHERVAEALNLVGLEDRHDHFPRQLSGGQEQRVAIARAIVARPPILVADEPTGDLDRDSASRIMGLLRSLNRDLGKTILMVTHDPKTAAFATRTLHLDHGRLVRDRAASGTPGTPGAPGTPPTTDEAGSSPRELPSADARSPRAANFASAPAPAPAATEPPP